MRLYFLILIIAVSGWAKDITIDQAAVEEVQGILAILLV